MVVVGGCVVVVGGRVVVVGGRVVVGAGAWVVCVDWVVGVDRVLVAVDWLARPWVVGVPPAVPEAGGVVAGAGTAVVVGAPGPGVEEVVLDAGTPVVRELWCTTVGPAEPQAAATSPIPTAPTMPATATRPLITTPSTERGPGRFSDQLPDTTVRAEYSP